jgi:hypothetical protein
MTSPALIVAPLFVAFVLCLLIISGSGIRVFWGRRSTPDEKLVGLLLGWQPTCRFVWAADNRLSIRGPAVSEGEILALILGWGWDYEMARSPRGDPHAIEHPDWFCDPDSDFNYTIAMLHPEADPDPITAPTPRECLVRGVRTMFEYEYGPLPDGTDLRWVSEVDIAARRTRRLAFWQD